MTPQLWPLSDLIRAYSRPTASTTVFLAQADPGGIYGALLQFGGVGILAAAALWWARSLYSREVKSYDRLEEEHRKLQESIRDEYVKTIVAATQAISAAMEVIAEIRRERR